MGVLLGLVRGCVDNNRMVGYLPSKRYSSSVGTKADAR